MLQIPWGKMLKTQGNHSKNREFCLDRSVATLLKCPSHLNTISFLIVWLYIMVKVKLQNLFIFNQFLNGLLIYV